MAVRMGFVLGCLFAVAAFVMTMVVLFAGYDSRLNDVYLAEVSLGTSNGTSTTLNVRYTTWNFCVLVNSTQIGCTTNDKLQQFLDATSQLEQQFGVQFDSSQLATLNTINSYYTTVRTAAQVVLMVMAGMCGLSAITSIFTMCGSVFFGWITVILSLLGTLTGVAIMIVVPVGYHALSNALTNEAISATVSIGNGYGIMIGALVAILLAFLLFVQGLTVLRRARRHAHKF